MTVVRHNLVWTDPTRANLLKICIELAHWQANNKALYTAYVKASEAAEAKYYSYTTFNDAQLMLGSFQLRPHLCLCLVLDNSFLIK